MQFFVYQSYLNKAVNNWGYDVRVAYGFTKVAEQ